MSKIIRKGRKNPSKPWIGFIAECPQCDCKFQLVSSDKVDFESDQREGDYYLAKCPSCKYDVTIDVDASLLIRR